MHFCKPLSHYINYWRNKTYIALMIPLFGETKGFLLFILLQQKISCKGNHWEFFVCIALIIPVICVEKQNIFSCICFIPDINHTQSLKQKGLKKVEYMWMPIISSFALEVTGQCHQGDNLNILADFIQQRTGGKDDWHVHCTKPQLFL